MFDVNDPHCLICNRQCRAFIENFYSCDLMPAHYFSIMIKDNVIKHIQIRLENFCATSNYSLNKTFIWKHCDNNLNCSKIIMSPAMEFDFNNYIKMLNKLKTIINFS